MELFKQAKGILQRKPWGVLPSYCSASYGHKSCPLPLCVTLVALCVMHSPQGCDSRLFRGRCPVFVYLHDPGVGSLSQEQGEEEAINEDDSALPKQERILFHCFLTFWMPQYYLSYCGLNYSYSFTIVPPYCNVDRDLSLIQLCISTRVHCDIL